MYSGKVWEDTMLVGDSVIGAILAVCPDGLVEFDGVNTRWKERGNV